MAVVPVELDRILADGFGGDWPGSGLEHWERAGGEAGRISGMAVSFGALLVTHRAGAGVAQVGEAIAGAVAVLPLDVHAGAGGQIDLDGLGVGRDGHEFSIAWGDRVV